MSKQPAFWDASALIPLCVHESSGAFSATEIPAGCVAGKSSRSVERDR